jgi:hypothetical protein
MKYFRTSFLSVIFLASTLAGAIPQPISISRRIPEAIEKRQSTFIDVS